METREMGVHTRPGLRGSKIVAAAALGGGTTAPEGSDSDNETSTIVVGCTRVSAGTVEHFPSSSITFLISGFISGFQGEEHRCCLTFLYPIVCCTADEKEALLRTPCLLNPPASPPSPFQSTNKWLSPSSESDIILPQFCCAAAAATTASLSLSPLLLRVLPLQKRNARFEEERDAH
jgi:hypothetical protein